MTMDPLRIVLILAGVVIVVGLYLWERRRRQQRSEPAMGRSGPLDAVEVGGFSATQATAEAWHGPGFAAGDEVAPQGHAIPVLDTVIEEGDAAVAPGVAAGDVLVLTVIADIPVPAPEVVDALVLAGLIHGRMGIFHYYPGGEGAGDEPWFSAANVLEPGTFELEAIDGEVTPGVALFAQLPGAADGEAIWEQMLAAGRTVAGKLDARLCDDARHPLDDAQVAALARRAQRFAAAERQPA
jgi:FtsZ-interacting cell division protein ZipA